MSSRSTETLRKIISVLPQTQCGQCGFSGCAPYAQALLEGEAPTHLCPPGGREGQLTLEQTLTRLGIAVRSEGTVAEGPVAGSLRAWIDPSVCIGCTRCIEVCPVDAIAGAPKRLHSVFEALCTGCDRCAPACPVDCITMKPTLMAWHASAREQAEQRHSVWLARSAHAMRESEPVADRVVPGLDAILDKARARLAARPHR